MDRAAVRSFFSIRMAASAQPGATPATAPIRPLAASDRKTRHAHHRPHTRSLAHTAQLGAARRASRSADTRCSRRPGRVWRGEVEDIRRDPSVLNGLDRGLGAAGVALSPEPVKGVLRLPPAELRSVFPVLGNPTNKNKVVELTLKQFHYAFTNTTSDKDSQAVYAGRIVARSRTP